MNRYQDIPIIKTADGKRVYATSRYPEIPLSPNDIYVYTTQGDRYDILALNYYGDSSLWWIIESGNPNIDLMTLVIPEGVQIRIPSNFSNIIDEFGLINQLPLTEPAPVANTGRNTNNGSSNRGGRY
jgi:phage tail protein X